MKYHAHLFCLPLDCNHHQSSNKNKIKMFPDRFLCKTPLNTCTFIMCNKLQRSLTSLQIAKHFSNKVIYMFLSLLHIALKITKNTIIERKSRITVKYLPLVVKLKNCSFKIVLCVPKGFWVMCSLAGR